MQPFGVALHLLNGSSIILFKEKRLKFLCWMLVETFAFRQVAQRSISLPGVGVPGFC